METYDLNKLINIYKDLSFRKEIPSKEFKYYFEGHEKINKPDFIAVIDLKRQNLLYFKNTII